MFSAGNELRRSGTLVELAAALTASVFLASPPAANAQPEQIIVTARKRPEPLGDVPLKIDVVTDDGAESGIDSLQNLMTRVPGLYFESGWGGIFSSPTLRGQQASPAGDHNVGIFIDGVYQANPNAVDAGPIDIDRVEVVNGPQSALFGHSTFAGAIHFVSAAPTREFESEVSIEAGSDAYARAGGFVSGPVFGDRLLGRLAVSARTFDGTQRNRAAPTEGLGGSRRQSIALQLATPSTEGFRARVTARLGETRYAQPAVSTVSYRDFNCGAIEPDSGAWSYFCGELPIASSFDTSANFPESDTDVGQLALTMAWPIGRGVLSSSSSYYQGTIDAYRDFDGSSAGRSFGVCSVVNSCDTAGGPWSIERFVSVNEVWRKRSEVTEWDQELRFSREVSDRLQWSVGVVGWRSVAHDHVLFGAERGDLADTERLTSIRPQTPSLVGPPAIENLALVADPRSQQVTQAFDIDERRTLALFGTLDAAVGSWWRTRFEIRATREERTIDSRVAGFAVGFGDSIPPLRFRDITPRVSVEYSRASSWSAYISAAKGSQSGGINPFPGLPPEEQGYAPEYNWTYELAARYRPDSLRMGIDATVFRVDWYDAQLQGFGQTIPNQITLNTAGIRTRGVELSWYAEPTAIVRAELQVAWTDPSFSSGSEDPGSSRFCGLTRGLTSNFCAYGPTRSGVPVLVPYIDGNVPARVPRHSWHAAIAVSPTIGAGRLLFRLDGYSQDNVYDRAINGARFGERTLIDLTMSYAVRAWRVGLWVRNLTDERYVRALSSRGQIYFRVTPRPLDEIFGEGRRFGVSLSRSISGARRS